MEEDFSSLIEESKLSGKWEFVSREKDVTISKIPPGAGERVSCFRGQLIIPFEPQVVAQLICDDSKQTKINPQLNATKVIKVMHSGKLNSMF